MDHPDDIYDGGSFDKKSFQNELAKFNIDQLEEKINKAEVKK